MREHIEGHMESSRYLQRAVILAHQELAHVKTQLSEQAHIFNKTTDRLRDERDEARRSADIVYKENAELKKSLADAQASDIAHMKRQNEGMRKQLIRLDKFHSDVCAVVDMDAHDNDEF